MTEKERQKLCAFIVDLRALEHDDKADLLERTADEIERLVSIVADYKMTFGDIHEVVMGAGITHEASHTDTENGEKSNAESAN